MIDPHDSSVSSHFSGLMLLNRQIFLFFFNDPLKKHSITSLHPSNASGIYALQTGCKTESACENSFVSGHHFHSVYSVIHASLCWSVKRVLSVNISLIVFVFAGNISLVTPSSYIPATKITLGTVNSNVGAPMVSVSQTHQCT